MEHIIVISTLVYGGYGLSRLPDGKAVFVPFVLPGEKVRIRIREEKKRHAYGELIEILEKNPARIAPKCKHYLQCGGCHYQHIPYAEQLRYKETIFKEQLQRMGGIESPVISSVIFNQKKWLYRNTVQFHITNNGEIGFMDMAKSQPFPVEECWLPMEAISSFWPALAFEPGSNIQRVEVRQNGEQDILLLLESTDNVIPEIEITMPITAVHSCGSDKVILSGDGYLLHELAGEQFRVSAGSFFQTNFDGALAMTNIVQQMAEGLSGTLLDLYCGVGLFSKFLASQFDRIIGIEASKTACDDFLVNMRDVDNVSIYQGPVEKVLPKIEIVADCVVVDPPRRGMNRFALDALVKIQCPVIIYGSCDPSTLGRDIKRLAKMGYTLKKSVIVDMFPNTYHIESVNLLVRG